ncbi:hypothetical protein G7Y29_07095 [Corynebacterium qintianiae]|uniref:DUF2567 domain-containing protein n=1 Tax=Corynebacterium qintianiae TaxID=2709392 RepID=A0A7T0PEC5_9CORY|nr:hypothetical protein [Corynebacterium qintianiae]QPK82650.1 hypothetical protein G7Y29_07095 [Corynebacterium qintianiae]
MKIASTPGAWAQLLVIALVAGSVAGALWGLTRPGYVGELAEGSYLVDQIASPANVEFASFGGFALLSAALGMLIAAAAHLRGLTGLPTLLWVSACAGAAAFAVVTFGGWSADLLHASPHAPALNSPFAGGAAFTFVPPLRPGVGWLAGPFVAALTFYLLTVIAELQEIRKTQTSLIEG